MALKKWSSDLRPAVLFATTHKDRTGGGELYAHQIAKQLDSMCDLRYYTGSTGNLHPDFSKYHGSRHRFTATALLSTTDIFVTCSHFQVPTQVGRHRNIVLTFFPNRAHRDAVAAYDTVVTCSTFSAKWVKKYWGKTAKVIYPFVNIGFYGSDAPKTEKTILNVGRFFREPHGHSKRQDVLIDAFAKLHRNDPAWKMVLAGSVLSGSDQEFVAHCKDCARGLGVGEAVEFRENVELPRLVELYAESEFYWHANGYGSDSPYETEHFGIVVAEAMASRCVPVIFRGGGCDDFPVATWKTPAELARNTLTIRKSKAFGAFGVQNREHVKNYFSEARMNTDVHDLLFRRPR